MFAAKDTLLTRPSGGYQISRSVRIRQSASAYLNRTPASASNRKTWTWSGWVKIGKAASTGLFTASTSGSNMYTIQLGVGGDLNVYAYTGTYPYFRYTSAVFRDYSAWYHFVVAFDSTQATDTDRIKIYVNGVLQSTVSGSGSGWPTLNYDGGVNNTINHQFSDNVGGASYFDGYLTEVNFIDGQALTPSSFGETNPVTGVWQPKRYAGTYGTNGFYLPFSDNSGADSFGIGVDKSAEALNRVELGNTSVGYTILGTMTFALAGAAQVHLRDNNPSTAAADPAGLGASTALGYDFGRAIKIRKIATLTAAANGTSVTSIFNIQYSDDNITWTTVTGSATTHTFSAGLAQSNTTDIDDNGSHRYWRLRYLSGTLAGNFWIATLDMYVNNIGPNSWFPVNISTTAGVTYDSMIDVPTLYADGGNGRGNYATWNPLSRTACTITNGNLQAVGDGGNYDNLPASIAFDAGGSDGFYWEFTSISNDSSTLVGICSINNSELNKANPTFSFANSADGWGYIGSGNKTNSGTNTSYGNSWTNSDVIGVAVKNGKIWFSKNGTFQASGDPAAGTNEAFSSISGLVYPVAGINGTNGFIVNFGQRPFTYTPPTGFVALNTQNLPTPTISNGANYMDIKLWTGNGTSQTITGLGFEPDFAWIKARSTTYQYSVYDAVRTTSAGRLATDQTLAEASNGANNPSFTSDGITVRSVLNDNGSGQTFVGWMWDAGTSTVTNTDGTISSQVRANPTAGFSVVTYTGTGANATVGHGLGVALNFIIIKGRNTAYNWAAWHGSFTGLQRIFPNTTGAVASNATYWNSATPTSTTFSLGSEATANDNLATFVAYCWSEVAGYSAFGKYTGNGSADGTFVFTGFRPRWIMIKASGLTENWYVYDSARNIYNVMDLELNPNNSGAEATFTTLDAVSNGFKLRNTNSAFNQSSATYIYAAFAENPFKNSLAR